MHVASFRVSASLRLWAPLCHTTVCCIVFFVLSPSSLSCYQHIIIIIITLILNHHHHQHHACCFFRVSASLRLWAPLCHTAVCCITHFVLSPCSSLSCYQYIITIILIIIIIISIIIYLHDCMACSRRSGRPRTYQRWWVTMYAVILSTGAMTRQNSAITGAITPILCPFLPLSFLCVST